MMAKYDTAMFAAVNAKAYRDYLAAHPDAEHVTLTRAQMAAICRDLEAYADLVAELREATGMAITRGAAVVVETVQTTVPALCDALTAEREKVRVLREAVEWYADAANWELVKWDWEERMLTGPADEDAGDRARAALAATEEGDGA